MMKYYYSVLLFCTSVLTLDNKALPKLSLQKFSFMPSAILPVNPLKRQVQGTTSSGLSQSTRDCGYNIVGVCLPLKNLLVSGLWIDPRDQTQVIRFFTRQTLYPLTPQFEVFNLNVSSNVFIVSIESILKVGNRFHTFCFYVFQLFNNYMV